MVMIDAYTPGRCLARLAKRLTCLDRPYLITGPQAAYRYHRWLTPLENLVTLQVYTEDVPLWHQMGGDGCQVFDSPPTAAQVQAAQEVVILDTALEPERYRRRRVMDGLAFVGPEDLCLDLVELAPEPPAEVKPPEWSPERPPKVPKPPEKPVQPPLVPPGVERRYRRVVIRTPVRWENWQDFYSEVIDPLIREGAEVAIHVELTGQSESGIRENTVELGIKESLFQRGVTPEIEAE